MKYVKDKTEKLNEVAKTSAYEEEGKRVIVYGNPMRPAMKSIDAATRRSFCVLVSSGTIIATVNLSYFTTSHYMKNGYR